MQRPGFLNLTPPVPTLKIPRCGVELVSLPIDDLYFPYSQANGENRLRGGGYALPSVQLGHDAFGRLHDVSRCNVDYMEARCRFNAVVRSSDDDDAWVIWSVQLKDRDGVTLRTIRNRYPFPNAPHKFVCNLPDTSQNYRFTAVGYYNSVYNRFNVIDHPVMTYSC